MINRVDEQVASEMSSAIGSANQGSRSKQGSRAANSTTRPNANASKDFERVLSSRAIQIGQENGVTAEFVTKQTAEQTVYRMDDLFNLFDVFQNSLYANDPEVAARDSVIGSNGGLKSDEQRSEGQDSQKFSYEESILVTILGENYLQFINQETGEWQNYDLVIQTFRELFEERIRYLFDADSVDK